MTSPALIHDPAVYRLGRTKRTTPPPKRVVKLSDHLKVSQLVLPPGDIVLSTNLPANTGVKMNDSRGCCTISGLYAEKQLGIAANGGGFVTIPDACVLDGYEKACGFDPANPDATDNGGNEFDVLTWNRDVGILNPDGVTRTKSLGFVEIEPSDLDHLRLGLAYFGGIYNGIELPISAQAQEQWSLAVAGTEGDPTPGSWGGHCTLHEDILLEQRLMRIRTWGLLKVITFDWWFAYGAASVGGAAYVNVSPDWAQPGKVAPSGLDLNSLLADLAQVAQ